MHHRWGAGEWWHFVWHRLREADRWVWALWAVLLFMECSLSLKQFWRIGDCRAGQFKRQTNESKRGRFLRKWQSGQITLKTNKSRALMMSLSVAWMFSFPPVYCKRRAKWTKSVFSAVPVIPTFGHWTVPCYSTLKALKQHLICPFLPGG